MKILSEKTLRKFRGSGCCEFCGRWSEIRQVHHICPRGRGGMNRMDIAINLITLGSPLNCACHDDATCNRRARVDYFTVVAQRESANLKAASGNPRLAPTGADLEDVVKMIARLSKRPPGWEVEEALGNLSATQREIALTIPEVKNANER